MRVKSSTVKQLLEWVDSRKKWYFLSVIFAIIGVASAIAPFTPLADIINSMICGNHEISYYLPLVGLTVPRMLTHPISTICSPK